MVTSIASIEESLILLGRPNSNDQIMLLNELPKNHRETLTTW